MKPVRTLQLTVALFFIFNISSITANPNLELNNSKLSHKVTDNKLAKRELRSQKFLLQRVNKWSLASQGNVVDSVSRGDYGFAARGGDGFSIFDIRNPYLPIELGTLATPTPAVDVSVLGNYAYVVTYFSGLLIIDISNVRNPLLVGTYSVSMPNFGEGVDVSGDYAYLTTVLGGVHIIDIRDRSNPTLAAIYNTPEPAADINVVGDYAYVANRSSLQIINISNPLAPFYQSSFDGSSIVAEGGVIIDVAVEGNYAYLAAGNAGLKVLDISDISSPILKTNYATDDFAYAIKLDNGNAYIADSKGLDVVKIFSDPPIESLWDIDGDGAVKPLTDGLLVLRYLFGFRGETLINSIVSSQGSRTTATDIELYMSQNLNDFDIDGDGSKQVLTDGLLLIRYLFGFRGEVLVEGAIGTGATRQTAVEIETYIAGYIL